MPAVAFSVQNLPFTEPMLAVWAQLVSLAGSKLEKQRMKKSLSRGLTGTDTAQRCNTDVVDFMFPPVTPKHFVNKTIIDCIQTKGCQKKLCDMMSHIGFLAPILCPQVWHLGRSFLKPEG